MKSFLVVNTAEHGRVRLSFVNKTVQHEHRSIFNQIKIKCLKVYDLLYFQQYFEHLILI